MDAEEAGDLYDRAVNIVLRQEMLDKLHPAPLSVAIISASLVERMEQEGVVGAPNHSGKGRFWLAAASTAALLMCAEGDARNSRIIPAAARCGHPQFVKSVRQRLHLASKRTAAFPAKHRSMLIRV